MSEPLTPVEAHETLDENGWLDTAAGPGCYALRLADPPDDPRVVHERWMEHFDVAPQWIVDGLADTSKLVYVGASKDIYNRILDHARADVRRAAILRVVPPVDVIGVKGTTTPFTAEFNYAKEWVRNGFTVWADGRLHGV